MNESDRRQIALIKQIEKEEQLVMDNIENFLKEHYYNKTHKLSPGIDFVLNGEIIHVSNLFEVLILAKEGNGKVTFDINTMEVTI